MGDSVEWRDYGDRLRGRLCMTVFSVKTDFIIFNTSHCLSI